MKKSLAQVCEQKSHKIYMGFDPREAEAYEVARFSIIRRSAVISKLLVDIFVLTTTAKRPPTIGISIIIMANGCSI